MATHLAPQLLFTSEKAAGPLRTLRIALEAGLLGVADAHRVAASGCFGNSNVQDEACRNGDRDPEETTVHTQMTPPGCFVLGGMAGAVICFQHRFGLVDVG